MNLITSISNNKIKQIIKLAASKAYRSELKLAVVYGSHLIEEAIKNNLLYSVFIHQNKMLDYLPRLKKVSADNIYLISDEVKNKINISDSDADIIGLIQIKTMNISENIYQEDCIIIDSIQDPGNLGTIMRCAVACGVKNIILSKACVDPYNLKVLRASQGIQFKLNIFSSVDLLQFIVKYKHTVIATLPGAKDSIYEYNLRMPCAWLFGNEGMGISKQLIDNIECQLAIPMQGDSESINVAMAATVCLFEMMRQRKQ